MHPDNRSTILVVDDEPKCLLLFDGILEPEGYHLLHAHNGHAAIATAISSPPDVILLDVMMPGLDGFETCRRLRVHPVLQQVPILLVTALDDRASRLEGFKSGADDFVSKPFDSVELRTRLRTITRLNRFRQLYEEQARFEAAIAHSPDGIVLADAGGRILHTNAAFDRLIDRSDPQVPFFNYLPEQKAGALQARLALPDAATSASLPLETTLLCSRHPQTIVEITTGRLPWQGATVFQLNVRDVTDRKNLEAQLLRSQRIEVLGQLAGGIIHDVNNELTAIMGSAGLLEMDVTGHALQYTTHIKTSAQRGAALLRKTLMFARGSDGEPMAVNPAELLAEIASVVRSTVGRNYTVTLDAPPSLPPVVTDPTQLHQIVVNLCVNARDAMPDGGSLHLAGTTVRIDATAALAAGPGVRAGDYVAVSVRDTGTGIPPEIVPRLFDPFFTTKPPDKGTGLGLAIVQRLVHRHTGFITLQTEVGKGTCFTCHFPCSPEPSTPAG